MSGPYKAEADRIGDNIQGGQDGERFIDRLHTEHLDPDELLRAILLAHQWSPDRLRGFARAIQKRLERGASHASR